MTRSISLNYDSYVDRKVHVESQADNMLITWMAKKHLEVLPADWEIILTAESKVGK